MVHHYQYGVLELRNKPSECFLIGKNLCEQMVDAPMMESVDNLTVQLFFAVTKAFNCFLLPSKTIMISSVNDAYRPLYDEDAPQLSNVRNSSTM